MSPKRHRLSARSDDRRWEARRDALGAHTLADIVQDVVDAGLAMQALREWPYVNGCRIHDGLVDVDGGRFGAPPPWNVPLMMGRAIRPR